MPLLADPTWYSAQQLDVYPRALSPVRPAYPEQAAQQGIGGEVTLLLMVDEQGSVEEVSVAQAAPEGYFEAAAVAAFRTARFEPAQKDGRTRSQPDSGQGLVRPGFRSEPQHRQPLGAGGTK